MVLFAAPFRDVGPTHPLAAGLEGLVRGTARAVAWSHPQSTPRGAAGQVPRPASCCPGSGTAPRRGLHSGGFCCRGKEIPEYLNKEQSLILVTLRRLFWEKQESLDKATEEKWESLPPMGAPQNPMGTPATY